MVSPVNADKLVQLLKESGYDPGEILFLEEGFKHGFDIKYQGSSQRRSTAENIPFTTIGDKTDLWNKLMKEINLKRVAGPFQKVPFDNFIQSPIGWFPRWVVIKPNLYSIYPMTLRGMDFSQLTITYPGKTVLYTTGI